MAGRTARGLRVDAGRGRKGKTSGEAAFLRKRRRPLDEPEHGEKRPEDVARAIGDLDVSASWSAGHDKELKFACDKLHARRIQAASERVSPGDGDDERFKKLADDAQVEMENRARKRDKAELRHLEVVTGGDLPDTATLRSKFAWVQSAGHAGLLPGWSLRRTLQAWQV